MELPVYRGACVSSPRRAEMIVPRVPSWTSSPTFERVFQNADVELVHGEQRGHRALRLLGVLVLQHLHENVGDDLPRKPESVLQPAALHFLATGRELLPKVIHFLLVLAAYDEGDRLGHGLPSILG